MSSTSTRITVPGTRGEIWIEHWHRYHFAARAVAGKRVLDVACGEGYGTALLAQAAAEVTGVDLSAEAIEHASKAYAGARNARFVCAPCTRLPLADGSIDVAVSFETIEHIADQAPFLDELARVLAPGGHLLFLPVRPSPATRLLEIMFRFKAHPPREVAEATESLFSVVEHHRFHPLEPIGWTKSVVLAQKP